MDPTWSAKDNRYEFHNGIKVFDWGKRQIQVHGHVVATLVPIEFHFKDNGDLRNMPSMAIVMIDPAGNRVVGEISLAMFEDVLTKLHEVRDRSAL